MICSLASGERWLTPVGTAGASLQPGSVARRMFSSLRRTRVGGRSGLRVSYTAPPWNCDTRRRQIDLRTSSPEQWTTARTDLDSGTSSALYLPEPALSIVSHFLRAVDKGTDIGQPWVVPGHPAAWPGSIRVLGAGTELIEVGGLPSSRQSVCLNPRRPRIAQSRPGRSGSSDSRACSSTTPWCERVSASSSTRL